MERWISILIGGVIAAAFLGPGTITTAARSGAEHGVSLLWALTFAAFACFLLQEASARLTIASGSPLGHALRQRFSGPGGVVVLGLVLGAIILGCAAYEAGNILGGVAGAELATDLGRGPLTLISAVLAFALLWTGNTGLVITILGLLVAVMGTAFALTAFQVGVDPGDLAIGLVWPTIPPSAGILVLGLIGTTVVPYNLFLGSGLADGQKITDARWGLALAIGLGALVSMAVVVVGSGVTGAFSFSELAAVLGSKSGPWAGQVFGWGLFAAGFSSAVTAPLAAAMTAKGVFGSGNDDWQTKSWKFRAVWMTVLAVGAGFGLADVKPIPVIILAQALNGALLPLVAVFLFVVVNDREVMGEDANGRVANMAMALVVAICTTLGIRGVLAAAHGILAQPVLTELRTILAVSALTLTGMAWWVRGQLGKPSRRRAS